MMLRYSNAETRLYESAIKHCLLSAEEKTVIEKRFKDRKNIKKLTNQSIKSDYLDAFNIKQSLPIKDYIKRPEANLFGTLKKTNLFPKTTNSETWSFLEVVDDIETEIKYDGYIKRHLKEIEKLEKNENLRIDKNINFNEFRGLSLEARQKLSAVRPETFGQASRISGVSPADISTLMVYLLKN